MSTNQWRHLHAKLHKELELPEWLTDTFFRDTKHAIETCEYYIDACHEDAEQYKSNSLDPTPFIEMGKKWAALYAALLIHTSADK